MTSTLPPAMVAGQDLRPEELRRAFGAFPTGVVAVAAHVDGGLVGLAASSFTSVSLAPPLVSVSIALTSQTWPTLRTARQIGVSVLAEEQRDACDRLAGPPERRFEGLEVEVSDGGAVTVAGALAQFECSLDAEIAAGDHALVLLRLHGLRHRVGGPLVFHRSSFGRLMP